jgi:hypothetical protein
MDRTQLAGAYERLYALSVIFFLVNFALTMQ